MLGIQRDPRQLTTFVSSLARNPRRQTTLGFWLCFWLLFLCVPVYGIDRGRRLDELYHTSWTYAEGTPGEVHALAQTTDGYLWVGAATGLFRFDGIRFQPYKPESGQAFPQRNVASLFGVPDGGLWVGYWYGGVSFIKNGTVTDYGKPEGLPSHAVLAFARDRQGAIWIAAGTDGLARLEGSRWRKIGTDWGIAGPADTVFVDHAGAVWVGTPTTAAYLVEGTHHFQIAAKHLLPIVQNFAEAPNGTLWMAEGGYGVRPVPLPGKNDGRPEPAVLVGAPAITFDNQGSLWIATAGDGIRRVPHPERLHPPKIKGPSAWQFHNSEVEAFTQQNGLTSDYVHCVLQDREGDLWFGTNSGLDRFRQSTVVSAPLQPISYHGALPIPSVHSFTTSALAAGDQGALWAAGLGPQVLLKIQNDKIVTQLRDRPVDCAYRDPNGVLWLATPSSVFRLAHEGLDTVRSKPESVAYNYHAAAPVGQGLILRQLDLPTAGGIAVSPQSRVHAMTQDRLGRLWISMESGTFRIEKSNWTSLKSLGGPQGVATAEFTDSEGRIWFGFANTVAMLDGDRVRVFSGNDGVQVGAVTSITGKGTNIWIGGELGLELFDGTRFRPVGPSRGSAFGGVSGIVADPKDGLWFSENRGIIHISEDQLLHLGSGKVEFENFGLLDGLTVELRGSLASPSAVQTTDGRIWFATTAGVAWLNPKCIVRNTVPPPVSIVSIGKENHSEPLSKAVKFAAGTHTVEIDYTALSFPAPQRARFRYRLDGVDPEWRDVGTRREASYNNLGPGQYRFRVVACNNDGVWNNAGASVDFSIARAFYQTRWFRAACIAFLVVLIWMLYRLRVNSVERRCLERNRAEEMLRRARAVGEIQRSLLPASLPEIPGFEMSTYYRPSEHASGDYYDVVPLIDDQWGFVMADVSGHGIPAAVIMTVMRTLIHAELPTNRGKSAGEFLEHVNRVMSETYLRDGRFVTVWAAVLNPVSRRLTYACAGHNPPRLLRGGSVLALDVAGGLPLGIDPAATYEDAGIALEPEDLLVIYTDGITEAMRPGIDGLDLFGTERLDRVLRESGSDRTCDCTERVRKAIAKFTNDTAPSDDQTMLILRAGSGAP